MTTLNLSGTAYAGPERRDTTPEGLERRRGHREAVDAGELPASKQGSLKEQLEAYLGNLPKPVLAAISAAAVIMAGTTALAWKGDVDTHVKRADDGYHRLANVEARADRTEHRVDKMEDQLFELRKDLLEASRWDAHRVGDDTRVAWLEARLRTLEKVKP